MSLCGNSLGELANMLWLDGVLRKFRIVVIGTIRLAYLVVSAFVVGCTALVGPDISSADDQFDLVGRMRIEAENSILRVDFHMAYDGTVTRLQVWGPLGVNRTSVLFGRDSYTIEDRRGQSVILHPSDLPTEVPRSVWQVGSDLGPWLRLQPPGVAHSDALVEWTLNGVQVRVEESQHVDGERVCKRMRLTSGAVEVLVLCDRWRLNES